MPSNAIRIIEFSVIRWFISQTNGTWSGMVLPKNKIILSWSINDNIQAQNGQPLCQIDFEVDGKIVLKFTNDEGDPNFLPIENIDHNKHPFDVVQTLANCINSEQRA